MTEQNKRIVSAIIATDKWKVPKHPLVLILTILQGILCFKQLGMIEFVWKQFLRSNLVA